MRYAPPSGKRRLKVLYQSYLLQLHVPQQTDRNPLQQQRYDGAAASPAAASPGQVHEQVRGVRGLGLARLGDVVVVAFARVDAHHQDDAQDHGRHGRRQVVGDGAQPDLLRQRQVQRACGDEGGRR